MEINVQDLHWNHYRQVSWFTVSPSNQATTIPTIKPTAIPTVTTFQRGDTVPFIKQFASGTWLDNELPSSRAQEFNLNTQAKPSLQPDYQRILL